MKAPIRAGGDMTAGSQTRKPPTTGQGKGATPTIKGTVRVLGGNGVCGVCRLCEDVVPVHRQDDGTYKCGNDHLPKSERRLAGRTWTPTKLHMLLELETYYADAVEDSYGVPHERPRTFCRRCREAVRTTSRGCAGSPWSPSPTLWEAP